MKFHKLTRLYGSGEQTTCEHPRRGRRLRIGRRLKRALKRRNRAKARRQD